MEQTICWQYDDYLEWFFNGQKNTERIKLNIEDSGIDDISINKLCELKNLYSIKCKLNSFTTFNGLSLKFLINLNCSRNKLTNLEGIQLPNLEYLNCQSNSIAKLDSSTFPRLKKLNCANNHIKILDIDSSYMYSLNCSLNNLVILNINAPQLLNLNCYINKLTDISANTPNLVSFLCNNNHIETIDIIMPKLEILHCNNNHIKSLDNLELPQLINLLCYDNQIREIHNLNLPNLQILDCYNNLIKVMSIQHIDNLIHLSYNNNPVDFIAPNLYRAIHKIHQNIYYDSQNVHDTKIQECVKQSIMSLIKLPTDILDIEKTIIDNNILSDQSKELLSLYMKDESVHTTLLITFKELLTHVWSRIELNTNKDEIIQILNQELNDSQNKCYTGKISRLINCLNGYDDLVQIQIPETEQISFIIGSIKEKLLKNSSYSIEKHKQGVMVELLGRGYDLKTIYLWIEHIE